MNRPTNTNRVTTRLTDLPAAFWWLWVSVLVTWVGRFVVPFLSLFLTAQVGMSSTEAGWLISAYGAGVMVSALGGGVLADRVGRKVTLLGSEAASVIVLVIIPQAIGTPLLLAPLLALYGLANGAGRPAIATMVGDLAAPEHRRAAYGFHTWAVNLGYAIGPVLAGLLAHVDYALLFYGQAVAVLIAALVVVAFVPDVYGTTSRSSRREGARTGLGEVLGDRVFVGFVALMFCYYCVYVQSTTTLPVVMAGQGFTTQEYGYLLTLNGLLLCALQVPAVRVLAGRPESALMVAFLGITIIGMLVQAGADAMLLYLASVALWTLGELGLHPTAQTVSAELASSDLRGRYQGTYVLAFSGASTIAPVVGGMVLDTWGSGALWLGCAGICAVVAVLLGLTAPARRRRTAEVERISELIDEGHDGVALDTGRASA